MTLFNRRIIQPLLLAFLVWMSQTGWVHATELMADDPSQPLDTSVTLATDALSIGDAPSLDPPLPGMEYTAFHLNGPTRPIPLNRPLGLVLISVTNHWSYWPQAPPTLL